MSPITKLLIANRAEIARRVIRTATAMGIHTVAIYADGDADAPFVREADEALALRGRTAAETYLDIGKVVAAARLAGADALHPGYGFLSENAAFAQATIDAGLTWVGPQPSAIAAMADKLAAKRLMSEAGVPVLPSVELSGDVGGAESERLAATVGLPALVKAAAGGGGRGMRVVTQAGDLVGAVASAQREAAASFGDGTVFLERYVTGARHVEVQVLADAHGNAVHCFERECSIQRRHQKIIEESPSPALDRELRDRMGSAALTAVKAIGYENAGTVEFLLTGQGEFFFLEVNTRLQVEHPVTEAVTGLDLVREQLLIAQGEPLRFDQADLALNGHAIEARVYAEDPEHGFLPATGTLWTWTPAVEPRVRFDSGVETGTQVDIEFDPLLAKVIVHAPTRDEAARGLALALERTIIQGVVTNRDFLVATLRHPKFLAGNTTTSFIDDAAPERRRSWSDEELQKAAILAALAAQRRRRDEATTLRSFPSGWRNGVMPPERVFFRHESGEILVEYRSTGDGLFSVTAGALQGEARVRRSDRDELDVELDGRRLIRTVQNHGSRWWLHGPGGDIQLEELPRFPEAGPVAVTGGLVAPLPGSVVSTHVETGDQVVEGQLLVTIEAMKMEHPVLAPSAGTVTELRVTIGDQVANGDLLVVLKKT